MTTVNVTGTANYTGDQIAGQGNVTGTLTMVLGAGDLADVVGLALSTRTDTSTTVTWAPILGATSYTYEYAPMAGGEPGTYSSPVSVSTNEATIAGLTPGQAYRVRIKAVYGSSGSSAGSTLDVYTIDAPEAPDAPTNLRTTSLTTTSVGLAWDAVAGATGYKVYVRLETDAYLPTPTATPASPQQEIISMTSGSKYVIKVHSTNGTFDSVGAAEITITIPSAALGEPSSLTVASISSTTANLTWTAATGASTYLIDWKRTADSTYGVPVEQTALAFAVPNLLPATGYTFRVRARAGTTVSTGVTVTGTTTGSTSGGGSTITPVSDSDSRWTWRVDGTKSFADIGASGLHSRQVSALTPVELSGTNGAVDDGVNQILKKVTDPGTSGEEVILQKLSSSLASGGGPNGSWSGTWRSEISGVVDDWETDASQLVEWDKEYWIGWAVWLDADMISSPSLSVMDLHHHWADGPVGPVGLTVFCNANGWTWRIRYNRNPPANANDRTEVDIVDDRPAKTGMWTYWVCKVRTGPTDTSFCKVWLKEGSGSLQLVADYSGPIGYAGYKPVFYPKFGLYSFTATWPTGAGTSPTKTMYTKKYMVINAVSGTPTIDETVMLGTIDSSTTTGSGSNNPDDWTGSTFIATNLVVNTPAAVNGDTMWLAVAYRSDAFAATTPSGWTLEKTVDPTNGKAKLLLYRKTFTADAAASSVTVAFSSEVGGVWRLLRTGKTADILDTISSSSASSFDTKSVTAGSDNSTLVHWVASGTYNRIIQTAGGMTAQAGGSATAPDGPAMIAATRLISKGVTGSYAYTPVDSVTGAIAADGYGAITLVLRASAAGNTGGSGGVGSTSMTVNVPAANSGDTQFIAVTFEDGSANSLTTPTGWTLRESVLQGTGRTSLLSKDLTADTAAADLTLSFSGAVTGGAVAWKDKGTYRVDASAVGASSTSIAVPSVTATLDASRWYQIATAATSAVTLTKPADVTLVGTAKDATAGPTVAVGYKAVNAGATGTQNWTSSVADTNSGISFILDGNATSSPGGADAFEVGSHAHGNPDGSDRHATGAFPSSTNTMEPFNFGAVRTHNVMILQRTTANGAAQHIGWWTGSSASGSGGNTYNWTTFDNWCSKMIARGHKILFNPFGCPPHAARLSDYTDKYGVTGGTSGPKNFTAWREMIKDTLIHFVDTHGAGNLFGVEWWNEPLYGAANPPNDHFLVARGYASGHANPAQRLYADICKYSKLGWDDAVAARSALSGKPVMIGAHERFSDAAFDQLFNAKDEDDNSILNHGNAISTHPYGQIDNWGSNWLLSPLTQRLKNWMALKNISTWPIHATEAGINAEPWGAGAWFRNLTIERRGDAIKDWHRQLKAAGYKSLFNYGSDNTEKFNGVGFMGNPYESDKGPIRTALNEIYTELQKS